MRYIAVLIVIKSRILLGRLVVRVAAFLRFFRQMVRHQPELSKSVTCMYRQVSTPVVGYGYYSMEQAAAQREADT
ncbi:hypothetical protein [Paenibacillus periandrae]|uniref:hypothetical protein n=1 Tax=Paenibacillus periandrae TaxID=1761741 RepID=UPI001F09235B|nr:hypothetical protein [Paenibacillus periandrae]